MWRRSPWQTQDRRTDTQPCCKANVINQSENIRYAQIGHRQLHDDRERKISFWIDSRLKRLPAKLPTRQVLASAAESESLLRFPAFGPHTLQRRTGGMTLAEFRSQPRMLREPRKLEERTRISVSVSMNLTSANYLELQKQTCRMIGWRKSRRRPRFPRLPSAIESCRTLKEVSCKPGLVKRIKLVKSSPIFVNK